MSGADETVAVYIPSETSADWDNEPCWCVECGWDGVEDDLTFTNDGVFVCPQCSSEDTDYYYSEEAESCVFCGSDKVVGVIDIVSLNEIQEATPLDKEQVYGYCARCADVKMAEGSTGDQIISWEDGAGVSSPSMPPAGIFWSESKKERIASGRKMHYAIPSEKKYPIWDKAHARMALAWSQGTKYADKVEKAVTKRFPTMNAETIYRNYPGRKGPSLSATSVKRGTRKRGNDGKMWEVRKSGRSQRWFRGAESFEALGEPDAPYDQGYDDELDESLGMSHKESGMKQSFKDRRDESKGTEKFDHSRAYSRVKAMDAESDPITQYILVDQSGSTHMMSLPMSSLVVNAAEAAQDDGYAVEIIGYSTKAHPWTGEPKDYLHEPRGGTDASVALEYIAEQNGGKLPTNAKYLFIVDEDMHPRYFKQFEKELNRSNTKIIFVTPSDVGWMGATSGEDLATHVVDTWNDLNTGIPMSGAIVKNDEMIMKSWEETGSVPDNVISVQVDGVWGTPSMFSAENMGLTQYVGSAGGSGDGTPVSYGGIALPESDVAAMVESSTENPMGASIGTVMGTMGAEGQSPTPAQYVFDQDNSLEWQIDELKYGGWNSLEAIDTRIEDCRQHGEDYDGQLDELEKNRRNLVDQISNLQSQRDSLENVSFGSEEVPVVPDPSSFPQGDGRVLGQQTDQANLSPLHAEDEDVQMVKIQDPVTTGAKMALGVVALNATAIAGAALIGLALTYAARKEE